MKKILSLMVLAAASVAMVSCCDAPKKAEAPADAACVECVEAAPAPEAAPAEAPAEAPAPEAAPAQ